MSGVLELAGRAALVTGGSRGVGRATALLLARAGATVALSYRTRREDAEAVVEEIRASGGRAVALGGELTDADEVARVFGEADEALGGLDLFVGNHGIWPPDPMAIGGMDDARWHRTLDVNLHSLFYCCRAAARSLRDGGRIVLVGSTAGQRGEAFHGDYAAAKGALVSLVKGFSAELAPRGITVNCVAPGWVDTEMAAPALEGEARSRVEAGIPLGRIAAPEDVAGPIAFLCSDLARHVTGEILNVNGGAVLVG